MIIGAGASGLAAAYAVNSAGVDVTILEAAAAVGGLARSFDQFGWRLDLGSHIHRPGNPLVDEIWDAVIGDHFHIVELRRSIQLDDAVLRYPPTPREIVGKLGMAQVVRVGAQTLRSLVRPGDEAASARDLIVEHYGPTLYDRMFAGYVEKLLGCTGDQIDRSFAEFMTGNRSPDEPKLRNLLARLKPAPGESAHDPTFPYPDEGVGALCLGLADLLVERGVEIRVGTPVTRIEGDGDDGLTVWCNDEPLSCDCIISSMPVRRLLGCFDEVPDAVRFAVDQLRVRSTVLVYLHVVGDEGFAELWRFVHDRSVTVGRVANAGRWWPGRSADAGQSAQPETVLVAEYWCDIGDHTWTSDDDALVVLATSELDQIGLLRSRHVQAGHVERVPATHPVAHVGIGAQMDVIADYLASMPWLKTAGRGGSHDLSDVASAMISGAARGDEAVALIRTTG